MPFTWLTNSSKQHSGLLGIARLGIAQLQEPKGMGLAKATQLKSALELGESPQNGDDRESATDQNTSRRRRNPLAQIWAC